MSRRQASTEEPFQTTSAALRILLAEVAQLGVTFRISGADVVIAGMGSLPDPLRRSLERHQQSGRLWDYLGGWLEDAPAVAFSDSLGVAIQLVETTAEAKEAIKVLIGDISQHGGVLAIDCETAPMPDHRPIRPAIRIKQDGGVYAVPVKSNDKTALDAHRSRVALMQLYAGGDTCFLFHGDALRMVAGSHWLRRQRFVAHNATFEMAFLGRYAPATPKVRRRWLGAYECTVQAAGLLIGVGQQGERRKLETVAHEILGLDMPKDLGVSDWGAVRLSPGQLSYAASDPIVTWRLWQVAAERLKETGRWEVYTLQRNAIPAVIQMELRGLGFDRQEHTRQSQQWAIDLEQAREDYHHHTGNPPPRTHAEIAAWLATVLSPQEMASWPRTKKQQGLATKAEYLERLGHIPSARPVLNIMAMDKLIRGFGPALQDKINPITGRLHCRFNIAATKAGRFSASDPNPQQFPSRRAPVFRKCIGAEPGNMLVCCDYNQVELRGAAWVSGDVAMTDLYANGGDLHKENAAAIAGIAIEDVTDEQRAAAKAVSFGSLYGIGPGGLVRTAFAEYRIELTEQEAHHALNTFYTRFPQFRAWTRRSYDQAMRHGLVRIGAGRVVEAAWEKSRTLTRQQCCNLPIQGICADAMLRAITIVHARLTAARVRGGLIATIHDELLAEVRAEDAERTKSILEQGMIRAFEITFPGAPTNGVTKAKIGKTWADVK